MKVLIVEDNKVSSRVLTATLEKHNYDVITAGSGKEAVTTLETQECPDIVVTDIMMPVMDGFHLMSYMKADIRFKRIPVILCTSRSDVASVKKAINLHAAGYITKPIDPDTLIKKLKDAETQVPSAVLVVDDEELIRNLLKRIVEREGYKVLLADSGEKALDLIEKNRVMIVLSDIVMPEMNGLELLEIIKNKYSSIKVLMITGRVRDSYERKAMDAGADGFITKPFQNTTILDQLRELLG